MSELARDEHDVGSLGDQQGREAMGFRSAWGMTSGRAHGARVEHDRRYVHLFDRQRTDDVVRQAMASAG